MKTQYKYIVPSILLLGAVAQVAFGTPPGSKYTPGETMDPGCSAGDVNCDVDISSLGDNIYSADGTTGAGRAVGVTDTLNFDNNTLVVNSIEDKVNIGNTFLNSKFSVLSSDSDLAEFYYNDGSTNPRLKVIGTTNKISLNTSYTTGGADLSFGTAPAPNALVVRNNGNIGIGMASPDRGLTLGLGKELSFAHTATGSFQGIRKNGTEMQYFNGVTSSSTAILHNFMGLNDVSKMIIRQDGNVGIGPTDLTYRLNVATTSGYPLRLSSSTAPGVVFSSGTNALLGVIFHDVANNIMEIAPNTPGSQLRLRTSGSEKIRIDAIGDIFIKRFESPHVGGSAFVCVDVDGMLFASEVACP